MKTFIVSALVSLAVAQSLDNLPACGRSCIQGMLAKAASLGCPPKNGVPDAACLCANKDFGYGIRDCTNESCPSGTDTNQVIQYGVGYCLQVASTEPAGSKSATIAPAALTGAGNGGGAGGSGSGSGSATGSGAGGSGSASASGSGAGGAGGASSPITTEAVLTTVVSDGKTHTSTVGSTTIFAPGPGATAVTTITSGGSVITSYSALPLGGAGASGASGSGASGASSASGSASSAASSAASSGSAAASSASGAASSAASSASGAASSAASSASGAASSAAGGASSSSSGGLAPMVTVAAHGLAGVAGLAAVMML